MSKFLVTFDYEADLLGSNFVIHSIFLNLNLVFRSISSDLI